MDKINYIKNTSLNYNRFAVLLFSAPEALDPIDKKYAMQSVIFQIQSTLKDNFLKKIEKGKINIEHTTFLMDWLSELVKEFNAFEIYSVKNDVVQVRDTSKFNEPQFIKTFDKGSSKKNLEQLTIMKLLR